MGLKKKVKKLTKRVKVLDNAVQANGRNLASHIHGYQHRPSEPAFPDPTLLADARD